MNIVAKLAIPVIGDHAERYLVDIFPHLTQRIEIIKGINGTPREAFINLEPDLSA